MSSTRYATSCEDGCLWHPDLPYNRLVVYVHVRCINFAPLYKTNVKIKDSINSLVFYKDWKLYAVLSQIELYRNLTIEV